VVDFGEFGWLRTVSERQNQRAPMDDFCASIQGNQRVRPARRKIELPFFRKV
jgi:hypothetical protein